MFSFFLPKRKGIRFTFGGIGITGIDIIVFCFIRKEKKYLQVEPNSDKKECSLYRLSKKLKVLQYNIVAKKSVCNFST